MYCSYLLALYLLLGVDAKHSTDHGKRKHDAVSLQASSQSRGNLTTEIVFDPKQMRELENALNIVVKKLLGPQYGQLSLRTAKVGKAGLVRTTRVISEAICREIKKLCERLGLTRGTKPESQNNNRQIDVTLKASVYHQLLRIPLTLIPIWREARRQVTSHIQRRQYIKMGYKSSKFEFRFDYGISTDQLKISAIASAIDAYTKSLYNCLEEKERASFDLRKALGSLTNFAPEITRKKLRIRLEKPIPKSPGGNKEVYTQYHAFVCRAVTEDSRINYYKCLVEIKRVDKCVHQKINSSSEFRKPAMKSSKKFLQTIKGLDNTCKNVDKGMKVLVSCKMTTKAKRSNSFPYVVDFFMGDLGKSPALERMARDVGLIIMKSRVGSEALNEVVTIIEIYKKAEKKKAKLMKAAQRDASQASIFSRISAILAQFKQHIFEVTHNTVTHMHNIVSTVEKILVDSASTIVGEDLSANVQTLRCWSGFMDCIFIDWSYNRSEFPAKPFGHQKMNAGKIGKESKRPREVIKVPNEVDFIRNPHEEPLNKLIVSMKRLGHSGPPRRSTALISLANTFLLATMFYECISLLATAIYRGDNGSMPPPTNIPISRESEENGHWQSSRDRRSSPPIDHEKQTSQGDKEKQPSLVTNITEEPKATTVNPHNESSEESEGIYDGEIPEKLHTNPTESSTIA